jgi:hypothetical protein
MTAGSGSAAAGRCKLDCGNMLQVLCMLPHARLAVTHNISHSNWASHPTPSVLWLLPVHPVPWLQLIEPKQIIRRPDRLGLGANPAAPPPDKRPRKMGEQRSSTAGSSARPQLQRHVALSGSNFCAHASLCSAVASAALYSSAALSAHPAGLPHSRLCRRRARRTRCPSSPLTPLASAYASAACSSHA